MVSQYIVQIITDFKYNISMIHNIVNIDFKIISKNSIQVNCSEISYISHVNLVIMAKEVHNRTVVCDNGGVKIAIFDDVTFECDKSHLIEAYYYDQDKKCDVRRVIREMPCSGMYPI